MMDNMRKNTNFFTNFRTCHCMKSVRIRSYSGPHFPAFGLNTKKYSVSLRIQSECGKMRTRIAPNRRFSYTGNWELVKSIVGTKLRRSYVCLHSQAGNRLWQLANGSALLHHAVRIFVQKLTQVIKSNTAEFLRIQKHNRKILKRILKRPLK